MDNPMIFREVSRIIIILIAGFMAYLGYRLFVLGHTSGPGKIETSSQFGKIVFSGAGPGLFFMAFGAIILIVALFRGEYFYSATRLTPSAATAPADHRASVGKTDDEVAIQVAASAAAPAASNDYLEVVSAAASAAEVAASTASDREQAPGR